MENFRRRLPPRPPWATPGIGDGLPGAEPGPSLIPQQEASLPTAPPRPSSNPFAKENLSGTLLDIGSAFLSTDDFFQGLGNAGQAIRGRQLELAPKAPKVSYGGPNDQFEISADPRTGERTIREVPEFAAAAAREREAKAAERNQLDPKQLAELRARAVYSISQLPEDQRSAAYAELLRNPQAFGGFSTEGMPATWNEGYGQVMGNMGATVNQARSYENKQEDQDYRRRRDVIEDGFTERRIRTSETRAARSGTSSGSGSSKLPSGFILD